MYVGSNGTLEIYYSLNALRQCVNAAMLRANNARNKHKKHHMSEWTHICWRRYCNTDLPWFWNQVKLNLFLGLVRKQNQLSNQPLNRKGPCQNSFHGRLRLDDLWYLCKCVSFQPFWKCVGFSMTHGGRHDSDILCLCGNEPRRAAMSVWPTTPWLRICSSDVPLGGSSLLPQPDNIHTAAVLQPLISSCPVLLHSYRMTSSLNDISTRWEAQHSHWTLCKSLVGMWTWVFGLPLILPNLVWFDFTHVRSRKFTFFSNFH